VRRLIRLALPSLPGHGYFGATQDPARWRTALDDAGSIWSSRHAAGTIYFLARKR